jgi:multiple sugar transport system ATP-binding protein
LAIGLRERNFAEAEIKKRIAAVAMELGLEKELEMNGQSLPPEQQRLVGLARVMVRQPNVYLFDEPFAGLESEATRHGRAEIVKLHQRSSATIVYATSSPAEALAFGKRTVIVIDGVIQQDGSAQEIYNAPANLAVARFFGEPPMNLIAGTLKQERDSLVFSEEGDGTIALSLPTDRFSGAKEFLAKSVVLGIRPEDISLEAGGSGFRALIQRTESRGGDTDLYLQTGAHSLIARNLCSAPAESGQRGQFRMALEKALLFDAKSGRRVPPEA